MTAQIHEKVILEGEETSMAFCPPLPYGHPRLIEVDNAEAARDAPLVFSTACWRGYVGTWEIKGGRFFLVDVRGKYRLLGADPLFANWFTGVLRIPKGKMLHYVHMGFASVYEHEVHIKIENGVVVASRVIDNRGKSFSESRVAKEKSGSRLKPLLPGWRPSVASSRDFIKTRFTNVRELALKNLPGWENRFPGDDEL